MKKLLTFLAKSILLQFTSSAAISAKDAVIQKKYHGSRIIALIISNEEMEDVMKIVKPLEESGLLIKRIIKIIKNKAKEQ